MIRSYRDLRVWQLAMNLVLEGYRFADAFPARERYALTAQMRRALVSVPCNIAEGHGRDHLGDYLRHLSFAYASVMEVETQASIGRRLGYVSEGDEARLLESTGRLARMLSTLSRRLRSLRNQHPVPST